MQEEDVKPVAEMTESAVVRRKRRTKEQLEAARKEEKLEMAKAKERLEELEKASEDPIANLTEENKAALNKVVLLSDDIDEEEERKRVEFDRQQADLKRKANRQIIAKQQVADQRMVRGRFIYHEQRGGTLKFAFKKYKNEPVKTYSLTDNQITEIPWGVVRHINETMKYPEYEHFVEDSQRLQRVKSYTQRAEFVPSKFS